MLTLPARCPTQVLVAPWRCEPGPSYTVWPTASGAALGLSAFAYAFGGHGLYPEQLREMAKPSRWPCVMAATYAVCIPLYVLCGMLGYYAYGDASLANINVNFPDNVANRLSIGIQCLQEVCMRVCRHPSQIRPRNDPDYRRFPHVQSMSAPGASHYLQIFFVLESNLVFVLALELRLGIDPAACCAPDRWGAPPWLWRLVLRTLFLGSQVRCRLCEFD